MPIKDRTKRLEYMKNYSKAHYAKNKDKYNPARRKRRALRREFFSLAWFVQDWVEKESLLRWIGPVEIVAKCKKLCHPKFDRHHTEMSEYVFSLFDGERVHGYGVCEAVREVGMFNGEPPFSRHREPVAFEKFAKIAKTRGKRKDAKTELTILILKLKEKQIGGRYGNIW